MKRIFPFVVFLLAAILVAPVSAQVPEPEHLPRRAKPPAPGVRPASLRAYGTMVAVPAATESDRRFDQVVDAFLLVYFRAWPVRATVAGLHEYDALFPATDSAGIEAWGDSLERFRDRVGRIDPGGLGPERRADHASLMRRIRQELEEVRMDQGWRRDPGVYVAIVSEGLHALVDEDFAPLEDRTWNVIARLTGVPEVFRNARANLKDPPLESRERAVEEAADLVRFLANRLPGRVAPLRDDVLREEFEHHLGPAVGAVAEYRHWLKTEVRLRSRGVHAPGAPGDSVEHVDTPALFTPLDSLLWR